MTQDVVEAVNALEDRRWAALTRSDTATLRELFAEEMAYTHSNAVLDDKQNYLQAIDDGVVAYRGVQRTDEAVRAFGDTAVVTGRAVIDAEARGRPVRTTARYSAVWARQDGSWRFVCWHATPVAD